MHDPATYLARRTLALATLQAYETWAARLLGGWLPGVVEWEAKHRMADHLWEHLQHARDLRTRLWELRVPKPDRQVAPEVRAAAVAIGAAPSDVAFVAGLYGAWTKAMLVAYEDLLAGAHPIQDAPTLPILRTIVDAARARTAWGEATVTAWIDGGETRREVDRWQRYVSDVLVACGGVDGLSERTAMPDPLPGVASPLPFMEAKRDARFRLALETGIRADEGDHLGRVLHQFANYGAEMQAAETLGSVLYEADDMPWDFYFDVGRHCLDEARHAKMGEERLAQLGHHVSDFPHSVVNYAWRQGMDPMRRYCTLTYVIEADSFAYKHATYRQHMEHGDHDSAQAVMFDIADETLHVRWGARWVPELMKASSFEGSLDELVAECRAATRAHSASPMQREAATTA